jgi:hypothetical protein
MTKKTYSIDEITDMYDEIHSDENYDSDCISTIICERLVDRNQISSNEEYFRFIYDIFDICRKYVATENKM